ncbi:hypothetical protein ACFLYU_01015 [Candidatus Dependentiae bacterium]
MKIQPKKSVLIILCFLFITSGSIKAFDVTVINKYKKPIKISIDKKIKTIGSNKKLTFKNVTNKDKITFDATDISKDIEKTKQILLTGKTKTQKFSSVRFVFRDIPSRTIIITIDGKLRVNFFSKLKNVNDNDNKLLYEIAQKLDYKFGRDLSRDSITTWNTKLKNKIMRLVFYKNFLTKIQEKYKNEIKKLIKDLLNRCGSYLNSYKKVYNTLKKLEEAEKKLKTKIKTIENKTENISINCKENPEKYSEDGLKLINKINEIKKGIAVLVKNKFKELCDIKFPFHEHRLFFLNDRYLFNYLINKYKTKFDTINPVKAFNAAYKKELKKLGDCKQSIAESCDIIVS